MSDRNIRIEYTENAGDLSNEYAVEAPGIGIAVRIMAEMVDKIHNGDVDE